MAGLLSLNALFEGRHFDHEIIVLCVRWYLRFKLSFRDLVEMMAERNLSMAHTTIMRWVHHYAPEFERRWNRFARPVGPSWRVDETYVKIRGQWADTRLRSSKYLNNLIEQDHRGVKLRIGPMLGFKQFRTAAIAIAGIELLRRRDSSTSTGCASKIEVRPPSGMRCWRRNKTGEVTLNSARCRPSGYLHQNPPVLDTVGEGKFTLAGTVGLQSENRA